MKKPGEQEQLLPRFVEDGKRLVASARLSLGRQVGDATAKGYARKAKKVHDAGGILELFGAGRNETAQWKAALMWAAKEKIRMACEAADEIMRRTDFEREGLRWKAYEGAIKKLKIAQYQLEETKAALSKVQACSKADEVKKEKGHKKRPLKNGALAAYMGAVGDSEFRPAFLAAIFSGARNQEFASGVRVRCVKRKEDGKPGILLTINKRAKQGIGKGQPEGRIFITAEDVSGEFAPFYDELHDLASKAGGEMTIKVQPTANLTTGERLTKIASHFGQKVVLADGSHPSFYSLRQTFASQVKAAASARHGQDWEAAAVEVAQSLGHQSTTTARYYGRAARGGGGGGFTPESVLKDSVAVPVRKTGTGAGPDGRAEVKARGARAREAEAISRVSRPGVGTLKPKGI